MYDIVIAGGTVVDGSRSPAQSLDIGILDGVVAAIAPPHTLLAHSMIKADGKIVCPGFVDIHSHADYTLLLDGRAHSAILQGVTSAAVGNCGHGIAPVSPLSADLVPMNISGWEKAHELPVTWRSFSEYMDLMRDRGVAINVFPLVAHGAMRLSVAGFENRALDNEEIGVLRNQLFASMAAGAAGFSTGLEYAPGISAPKSELISIAEGMRDFDGLYATHCRNRSDRMAEAAEEAIAVAMAGNSRLQLSHFIRRPYASDEIVHQTWKVLTSAQAQGVTVFADVFPFDYGPTPLAVMIPPALRRGGRAEMAAKIRTDAFRAKVFAGMGPMFESAVRNGLVNSMYVAADGADGQFIGKSLAEVASALGVDVTEAAYRLLRDAGENFYCVTIVENWVRWQDLVSALSDERFFIMGDGASGALDGPLTAITMALADWGYAPRFLEQFVRTMKLVSLEDAVYRMSTGPAEQLGLKDRGRIAVNFAADLVVFDSEAIGTTVSPRELKRLPTGIEYVLVNGQVVVTNGHPTGSLPGIVGLRHS